jgi:hypothetical protein
MAYGYEVGQFGTNGKWYCWYYDQSVTQHYYNTLDQAKASAQADYDRRTAERFRKVELPEMKPETFRCGYEVHDVGWNKCLQSMEYAISQAIAKAKEQP